MKKRGIFAVWISIMLLTGLFTGCGNKSAKAVEPINNSKGIRENEEKMVQVDSLPMEYIQGQKEFAFRIFHELKGEENIFFSPYSISTALSMLYNGADGNTRREMAELLGYGMLPGYTDEYSSGGNQQMNAYNKYLMDTLQKAGPKVQLNLANSIWMAKDEKFADSIDAALLTPVRNYYNGDIFQVDFTGETALKQVNNWVSDRTDGMINPFLQQFTSPEKMRLLLINAIYFNGTWRSPFSPDDTVEATFHGLTSNSSVNMMYLHEEEYRYYSDNSMQGLELPYGDGEIVMDVLIPQDKELTTIGEVYDKLSSEEVNDFLHSLDKVYPLMINRVGLPKFTMEYGTVELKDILNELGMKDAFDPSKADFGKVGDNLVVSSVVHKAKIEVEEWGTRASAVTGVTLDTTAALVTDPLEIIVDVPFLFFIRDKVTDTILFMGEMNNL